MLATEKDTAHIAALYEGRRAFYGELHDHAATGGTSDGKRNLDHWKGAMEAFGMDFAAMLPFGIGIIGSVIGLARPVNCLLGKRPSEMYHAIFGIVLATTLPVLIFKLDFANNTLLKIGFLLIGFVAAWLIDQLSRKYAS